MLCPECEKETLCEKLDKYTLNIRGEDITIPTIMYKCSECGEVFNIDTEEDIFEIGYREYRKKHGMLQPEEIKKLRKKYGLTQKELANILGIGFISIHRYENGSLQEKSHDTILQTLKKPKEFLELLEKNKEKISYEKYEKVKNKILKELNDSVFNDFFHIEKEINLYNNEFRGNKKFSINKFIGLIEWILKRTKKLNISISKTQLNKLLFYCDFKFFKMFGTSITGMAYAHLPYGPCPEKYHTIYGVLIDKDIIKIKEEFAGENYVVEKFELNKTVANYEFTIEEEKIINEIIDTLASKSAKELSDISHEEIGYKHTKDGQFIKYEYAKNLKI